MPRRYFGRFTYLAYALIGFCVAWGIYAIARPVDEVVLTLGEPYEQLRKQSRSTLPAAEPGTIWGGFVTCPAKLHFNADGYSFTTPAAKFLYVGTNKSGEVESVTISPQTETLPLDQALAIMQDIQEQLLQHGWNQIRTDHYPPIGNSSAMLARIRQGDDPQTFWQVPGRYQIALDIRRFIHEARPEEERYLITLELSGQPLMEDYPGG